MSSFLQFLFSGLTVGSVYAIVAIGFTIIYAASDVINFAQGEFVMIGGMATVFLSMHGFTVVAAMPLAIIIAVVVGILLQLFALSPVKDKNPVTLIIITLGASIFLRGVAGLVFDKQFHSLPPFTQNTPINVFGASLLPQSLWVLGLTVFMFVVLWLFLNKTLLGKALRATAANRTAAPLVGINVTAMLLLAFGVSAALGALAGIAIAPITLTRYDIGILLSLKGFAAAILGGLGNPVGAALGGFVLGIIEALAAGYISSVYKDGVAFIALIAVLLFLPQGLLGTKTVERV